MQKDQAKSKIIPRVQLRWWRVAVIPCNMIFGTYFFAACDSQSVLYYVSYVVSCTSCLKLIPRITDFSRSLYVMTRTVRYMVANLVFISAYLLIACVFSYNLYHRGLSYCKSPLSVSELSSEASAGLTQKCQVLGGTTVPFRVNYDTFLNSLFAEFATLDRGLWYAKTYLELSARYSRNFVELLASIVFTYVSVVFINISLRGVGMSLSYISLEMFGSVRMDSKVDLSKAQIEWVKTQELLSGLQLLIKQKRARGYFSRLSQKIIESNHPIICEANRPAGGRLSCTACLPNSDSPSP